MAIIPRYLQVCNLREGTDTYMFKGLPQSVVGKSLTSKQDFVHTVFAKYLNPKPHIHHQTQQILSKGEKKPDEKVEAGQSSLQALQLQYCNED